MAFERVNAISCTGVAPASAMWYPEMEIVFQRGNLLVAVGEHVTDQSERLLRRVDVGAARDVLLEHVVLDGPGELVAGNPLLLRDQLVEQQEHRARRVDRHRGGHLVERQPVEKHPHVVDRVDRDADLADLAVRDRLVAVVAHLGRQVEGHAEAAGAGLDELVVPLVRLLGGAEPGVLPHRPRAAGVHRRIHASGVGVLARLPQLGRRVEPGEVVRSVRLPDGQVGLGAGFLGHGSQTTEAGVRRVPCRARGHLGPLNRLAAKGGSRSVARVRSARPLVQAGTTGVLLGEQPSLP